MPLQTANPSQTLLKNYVGISLDKSCSMDNLTKAAMNDFNSILKNLQDNSSSYGQETILSVVSCGVGPRAAVERDITIANVNRVQPLTTYKATGHATPLYNSIFDLISQFENLPDAKDPNVSFLVMAVTDGGENVASHRRSELRNKIQELQATDRWTFVFRVPKGLEYTVTDLGVPSGNIQTWETTERGMRESSASTQSAMSGYYSTRSAGATSTSKFFADLSTVSQETIKNTLTDISSEVALWPVSGADVGSEIRNFCRKKLGHEMKKGAAFYQLNKLERVVQDYKKIIVRDKSTNAIYAGRQARDLLNLPHDGNISLSPGNLGNYDVFIQSTSVNRKLEAGTQLLYWEDIGVPFKYASAPVVTPPVAPVAPYQPTYWNPPVAPVIAQVVATPKPVVQAPPAPSKAVPTPVKVAPKKRVRNRNIPQEQIRKLIAAHLKTGARNVKNYSSLFNFDQIKRLTLAVELSTEFGVIVPIKEISAWTTVSDVIDSVVSRIATSK